MKTLYFLAIIVVLVGCKNGRSHSTNHHIFADTVATAALPDVRTDTITKVSKPFPLNGIMAYWTHSIVRYYYDDVEFGLEIDMKLADHSNNTIMLEYGFNPKYVEDFDYHSGSYFDSLNKKHFDDLNFDGLKDFFIYSHGSMPMTSLTNIYIFDNKARTFEYSEALTDNMITQIDTINMILVTESFDMEKSYQRRHHFDKYGKIEFSEIFTTNTEIDSVYYEKVSNGKVIKASTFKLPAD